MSAAELAAVVRSQAEKIAALEHQLEWFRRQIFGQKSERFAPEPDPSQMHLGETFPVPAAPVEERKPIAAHTRRAAQHDGAESGEELPFFDESKVPVQTLTLVHADVAGPVARSVRGHRREGDVPDRPAPGRLPCPEDPSARDQDQVQCTDPLSCRHPPECLEVQPRRCQLCRRAADGQVRLAHPAVSPASTSRRRRHPGQPALADPGGPAVISLLTPIYEAQLASIRSSRVKAMDETPIKAGRAGHGKMHTGYFWPIYGQLDEVCFPFHASRSADFVCQALGIKPVANAVLAHRRLCRL
jgi:transposase